MQTGAATVESSMEIPQKIENESAFWSSESNSENLSEETQNTNLKDYKHPYVHFSVIYNHQDMEAAQVPISRWVDKTTMGHLHNGILPGSKKKKKEKCTLGTVRMDLENIMLSEISELQKEKYHMISLICGI